MNNVQRIEINGCFISSFRSNSNAYLQSDVMGMVVKVVVR
jgi:hypothetical protein